MNCDYCLQPLHGEKKCCTCGAPVKEKNKDDENGHYFPYNGYVVWVFHDQMMRTTEWAFYLGAELINKIRLPNEFIDRFRQPGENPMPMIWGMFCVAQGINDEIVLADKVAKFRITRILSEGEGYWNSVSQDDVRKMWSK